jgi:predicted component of type VI protein secretion system
MKYSSELAFKRLTWLAVIFCGILSGCDREQAVSHRHRIEMTVTGTGQSWTNLDGTVWVELKFYQKPDNVTPIHK